MINILVSIIPIILYLVVLYAMDGFMLARWRLLASMLLWGIMSMLIALGIVYGYRSLNEGEAWTSLWISPVIEESLKCVPLLFLIFRRRIAFFAETLIYGQMIGGGFAFGENILYAASNPYMTVNTALVRGFDTALMHMGSTALIGLLVLLPVLYMSQHKCSFKVQTGLHFSCFVMLAPSISIHYIHNLNLVEPFIQLIIIVIFFFILFSFIEHVNEKLIIKWMDISINEDIRLLRSLKDGTLMETKAGEYLVRIRDKFDSLVFFDMCVYISLYLELLISAKSCMMLREAGLEQESSPEELKLLNEKKTELQTVAKRIPKSAHRLLLPLIHTSNQNKWAIDHL